MEELQKRTQLLNNGYYRMVFKITFSALLIVVSYAGTSQSFPKEYELAIKANPTFGPEYQVNHLILFEDSSYTYDYYQSISKADYLISNYNIHRHEKGSWSVKGNKLVLSSQKNKQASWRLIIGKRWNLYFLRTEDRKGAKFKKTRGSR